MGNKKSKVVVGLSGGVDSSAALILLKKQGFQPIGVSFKYAAWQDKRNKLRENACCSVKSFEIARSVCQRLKIPYHIIDDRQAFRKKVMDYYLSVLRDKKTPNPCIICNRLVKFEKLFKLAEKFGAEYVATGHYARIKKSGQRYQLLRAKDKNKDQSYFLCLLEEKQLKRIIFPLGNYQKQEAYQIAEKAGFDYFKKLKQSQDLCFVSRGAVPVYLKEKLGTEPGEIVDLEGNFLGKHQGLYFYTIGQRKGLNLPQGPWYVVKFDRPQKRLVVTNRKDDPVLFVRDLTLKKCHFISSEPPLKKSKVLAKTRFNQKLSIAYLYPLGKNKLLLSFIKPQKAVTPGQWAVYYDKEICLGGGVIDSVG